MSASGTSHACVRPRVSRSVDSGNSKRFSGHSSQEVCPWNVTLAQALPEGSPFAARAMLRDTDTRDGTRALAREILMMEPADYAAAFRGSAIKRAKLWMLQRNACVVLGNVGTDDDLAVLDAMRLHEHKAVREHAAYARGAISSSPPGTESAE